MVKQTIRIFCRVKPTRQKSGIFSVDNDESSTRSTIEYVVPRDLADGFINNKRESYKFAFERVFEQHSKQDEVFEHVAKDVIDNVLAGYNGTIFAYGQTGSGKTFTITGGAEKFSDRGIIPRALSYIFEKYENDKEHIHTTEISYLEIYNDSGYDLLDPRHEAAKLEDLPKVALMEDPDQCIHLKNLSVLPAQGIEEALNLLFLGDTNRMIAETPMNQASTRSHCIFTIHVTSREPGSATIRRSKLHLVDLAGSERVTKSNVGGQLLTEAKYINLSLHFLEQVIVALSEKNRQHIPYRNSMMTSVLRDSLGGNCMTTMIATVAVDKRNVDESISTCRFAQRVALIKNEATLNEELDPKLMIVRLKKEIQSLKDELGLVTGEQRSDELTKDEIEQLEELIKTYLEDSDLEATLNVGGDMRKIQYSYKALKNHALKQGTVVNSQNETMNGDFSDTKASARSSHEENSLSPMEVKRLKEILMQRDNEINILVTMLKKERKRALDAEAGISTSGNMRAGVNTAPEHRTSAYNRSAYEPEAEQSGDSSVIEAKSRVKDPEMSAGRQEAYEMFKQTYIHNQTIVDQKERLKRRYSEAKTLGMQVNDARTTMNTLKADLDLMKKRRAIQAAMNESTEEDSFEENEREALIRQQMEEVKIRYKESFTKLKAMKAEIDHLHHLLDKTRVQMQRDFDVWWEQQCQRETVRTPTSSFRKPSARQIEVNGFPSERQNPMLPPRQVRPEEAWRTPPESPLRHGGTSGNGLLPMPPLNPPSVTETRLPDPGAAHSLFRQGNPMPHLAAQFKPNSPMGFAPPGALLRESQGGHESSHSAPSFQARGGDTSSRPQRSFSSEQPGMKNSNAPKLPLTGDRETDANILAFIKARETLMQRGGK